MVHWLAQRRKELGLKQSELADILAENSGEKRSQSMVSYWEQGNIVTMLSDPKEAQILSDALQLSLEEMFIRAGYNLEVAKIGNLNIPADVMAMLEKLLSTSEAKRKTILRLVDLFFEEIPDTLPPDYQIPPKPEK